MVTSVLPGSTSQSQRTRTAAEHLAVALDYPSASQAFELVSQLSGTVRWFKVGMQLFYAAGNSVVTELKRLGYSVFLDLKLHDIPNTVASAIRSVGPLGADLLTVHASGGPAMLQAAAEAAQTLPSPPRLLAVTVLTSMDREQLAATGIGTEPGAQVARLAVLAAQSGITGLVASPEDAHALREALGRDMYIVTPGIRPAGTAAGDQKRFATPATALAGGADLLVVGRPITHATDPAAAAAAILQEVEQALPAQ